MQNLRLHLGPLESESAFQQDPQVLFLQGLAFVWEWPSARAGAKSNRPLSDRCHICPDLTSYERQWMVEMAKKHAHSAWTLSAWNLCPTGPRAQTL